MKKNVNKKGKHSARIVKEIYLVIIGLGYREEMFRSMCRDFPA